jgi:NAD(P)-dependent dehydrogenase (short-subunit alcohol dehydrogenase family)
MFDLSGRRALVTGAGQGVGVGIARALAGQGAAVAVNDLVASRADDAVQVLAGLPGRVAVAPFDVTDADAARAGIAAAEEQLGGPIDILVNNAGVPAEMAPQQFRDMDPARWAHYVDLNLYGSLHCIATVVDGMCEREWGRIVQISSGAGRTGLPIGVSLYGAGKSAIEGFVRHLAAEVARYGVTANAIALGLMHRDDMDRTVTQGLERSIPVGRLGRPDDVGPAVVYVASDEAAWLTGQTIDLNGGSTMH